MHSDGAHSAATALFLFAHQDDEFGVFQKITDELHAGSRVICAYFTDATSDAAVSQQRNQESLAVLADLGVQAQDIFFVGETLHIPDAALPEHLAAAENWLENCIETHPQLISIYVPAWEGGHPDHDALHAVTVMIAARRNLLPLMRQFSLYNGYGCWGPLFRVFLPLPQNGAVEAVRMRWRNRLQFLRYCLRYPSQFKTWIGLFPFVFLHYLFNGSQELQAVSLDRIWQRPHVNALYYERRGFYTWGKMTARLRDLDAQRRGLIVGRA